MTEELKTEEQTLDLEAAASEIADAVVGAELPLKEGDEPERQEAAGEPVQTEQQGAEPAAASPGSEPTLQAPPPDPSDRPPDSWTKPAQAKWASIDPEVKADILRRERNIQEFVSGNKNAIAIGKRTEQIITPYVELYQRQGIDPWAQMSALLKAHASLSFGEPQQKVEAFTALAAQAGIDLAALSNGQYQQAATHHLNTRIAQLEGHIQRLEGGVNGVSSRMEAAVESELAANIQKFAADEVAHPYFWEAADDIKRLIESGYATSLEDAYSKAVWANPLTRQKLVEADAAKRAANLSNLEKARVEKARKASAANVRSTATRRDAPKVGSIDDTLKATLAEIHAREA